MLLYKCLDVLIIGTKVMYNFSMLPLYYTNISIKSILKFLKVIFLQNSLFLVV